MTNKALVCPESDRPAGAGRQRRSGRGKGQAAAWQARKAHCAPRGCRADRLGFCSQDSIANTEASFRNKKSKIVVKQGQIVKVSQDAHGIVSRELLTQQWRDWIDYWAVDFFGNDTMTTVEVTV